MRTGEWSSRVSYHLADATDESQLLALGGDHKFDGAVCANALMDMPAVEPLFRAAAQLLQRHGRLVISIMHPCFNGLSISMSPELPDYATRPTYSIKVSRYLSAEVTQGMAIPEQPEEQYYWHRPLNEIFNRAFNCGFVLDRLEEPALKLDVPSKSAFDWANYDMPPMLFARLRLETR